MRNIAIKLFGAMVLALTLAAGPSQAGVADMLFASGGVIVLRFEGSDAAFESVISVNDSPEIFSNQTTPVGTEMDLGIFAAGTPLDVVLHVLTTDDFFHTGPGDLNVDGLPHALVTVADDRTFVGFEDLFGGGDRDFNDYVLSLTNVTAVAVPEPSVVSLIAAMLCMLAFMRARRHARL